MVTSCQVEILTKDYGILAPEVAHLRERLQVARLRVTHEAVQSLFLVAWPCDSPFRFVSTHQQVATCFPGYVVVLLHEHKPGRSIVTCEDGNSLERALAADYAHEGA